MASMSTLSDAFPGSTLNAQWTAHGYASGTATVASSQLTLFAPAASPPGESLVWSAATYDLTGSYALVNFANVGNAASGNNDQAGLQLMTGQGEPSATYPYLGFLVAGNTLYCYYGTPSATILASPAYSATNHAWCRIRESGGTIYWDTSSDGTTWTNRASVATPITITALYACLYANPTASVSETAVFASFNPATSFSGSASTGITLTPSATGTPGGLQGSPSTGITLGHSATATCTRTASASTSITIGASATGSVGTTLMETLTDQFVSSSLDTSKWTAFTKGSGAVSESSTGLTFTLPSGQPQAAGVNSAATYDLTGSFAYIEVASGGHAASSSFPTDMGIALQPSSDTTIETVSDLHFYLSSGNLYAGYRIGGGATEWLVTGSQPSWSSIGSPAWFRIRESSGTTYWDTSPDGVTWTNRYSHANPITVTALYCKIWAQNWDPSATSSTEKFQFFNSTAAAQVSTGIALSPSAAGTSVRLAALSTGVTFSTNQPVALLSDTFTSDSSLNTALWATFVSGTATVGVSGTGGGLQWNSAGTPGTSAAVGSQSAWKLYGSSVVFRIGSIVPTTSVWLCLGTSQSPYASQAFIGWNGGYAVYSTSSGGPPSTGAEVLVSGTAYTGTDSFVRVRESAGTVYWDTSPDGSTWTNYLSLATPIPLDTLYCWAIATATSVSAGVYFALEAVSPQPAAGAPATGITIGTSATGVKHGTGSPSTGVTTGPVAVGAKRRSAAASTGAAFGSSATGIKHGIGSPSIRVTFGSSSTATSSRSNAASTGIVMAGSVTPPISLLTDNFAGDSTLNTTLWTVTHSGATPNASIFAGGGLEFNNLGSGGAGWTSVASNAVYALYDGTSLVLGGLSGYVNFAADISARFCLGTAQSVTAAQAYLGWRVSGGNAFAVYNTGSPGGSYPPSGETVVGSALTGGATWLRVREQSGTIYWDYSSSGLVWTNLTSVANPIGLASLYAWLAAGTTSGHGAGLYFNIVTFNPVPPNTGAPSTGFGFGHSATATSSRTAAASTGIAFGTHVLAPSAATTGLTLTPSAAGAKRRTAAATTGVALDRSVTGAKAGIGSRSAGFVLHAGTNNPIGQLSDTFSADAAFNTSVWVASSSGSAFTSVTPGAGLRWSNFLAAGSWAAVGSRNPYTLYGSSLAFNTGSVTNVTAGQYYVRLGAGTSPTPVADQAYVGWAIDNSAMYAVYSTSTGGWPPGSETAVASYSGNQPWVRVREQSGTTYWDYSSDGVTWTNLTSLANPIDLTNLYGWLVAGRTGGSGISGVLFTAISVNPQPLQGAPATGITLGSSAAGGVLAAGSVAAAITLGHSVTGAKSGSFSPSVVLALANSIAGAKSGSTSSHAAFALASSATGAKSVTSTVTQGITLAASVTGGVLATGSVTSAITLGNSVTGAKRGTGSFTAGVTLASSVTGGNRAAGAVTAAISMASSATGAKSGSSSRSAGVALAPSVTATRISSSAASTGVILSATASGAKSAVSSRSAAIVTGTSLTGFKRGSGSLSVVLALAGSMAGGKASTSAGTAAFAIAASATGGVRAAGTVAAGIALTSSATGTKHVTVTATTGVTFSSSSTAAWFAATGMALGTSVTGTKHVTGTVTTGISMGASAATSAPVVAGFTLTAAATGGKSRTGAATTGITVTTSSVAAWLVTTGPVFGSSATGIRRTTGTASTGIALGHSVTGTRSSSGTATARIALAATSTGASQRSSARTAAIAITATSTGGGAGIVSTGWALAHSVTGAKAGTASLSTGTVFGHSATGIKHVTVTVTAGVSLSSSATATSHRSSVSTAGFALTAIAAGGTGGTVVGGFVLASSVTGRKQGSGATATGVILAVTAVAAKRVPGAVTTRFTLATLAVRSFTGTTAAGFVITATATGFIPVTGTLHIIVTPVVPAAAVSQVTGLAYVTVVSSTPSARTVQPAGPVVLVSPAGMPVAAAQPAVAVS